jgi:hypothetical protein
MIHFKGLVERQVNGQVIVFKFNMAALVYFGDLCGLSLRDIALEFQNPRLSTITNFLYAGAVTYCRQEKKVQTFTQDDAAEWLAQLGLDEVMKIFSDALSVPTDKEADNAKN